MDRFGQPKAGFALDISDDTALKPDRYKVTATDRTHSIVEWEEQFWTPKLGLTAQGDPVYRAMVDTTFALYDRDRFRLKRFYDALRIGGAFTATHLPWLRAETLPLAEAQLYRATQAHSFYFPNEAPPPPA